MAELAGLTADSLRFEERFLEKWAGPNEREHEEQPRLKTSGRPAAVAANLHPDCAWRLQL